MSEILTGGHSHGRACAAVSIWSLLLFAAVLWLDTQRNQFPYFYHPDEAVKVEHAYPGADPEPHRVTLAPWERSEHVKEEEFARALALALFDYMRKSRSAGFVVSISGGADSAAVASTPVRNRLHMILPIQAL